MPTRMSDILRKALVVTALLAALTAVGDAGMPCLTTSGIVLASAPDLPDETRMSPAVQRALAQQAPEDRVPVIVTTDGVPDEAAARGLGASIRRRFQSLDGYAASVPAGALRALARSRGVRHISFDLEVRAFNDLNYATVGGDVAGLDHGLTGNGVTVAVVDSGVASHPDLGSRLRGEVEIVGHESGFADYFGHGTHVAGIIAGDGSASSGGSSFRRFNGLAPQANVISVRVLRPDGSGLVSDVLAGIDWVIANRDLHRIRVMNLSLGHPVEESYLTDPLCLAVERAWKAGIVVVASAGNKGTSGYATINSPGNDPAIITVGASNNYRTTSRGDDILTTYTSRGPTYLDHIVKPDLVAPGNRTISLRVPGSSLDSQYPELRVKKGVYLDDPAVADLASPYFEMSGTSMATPVVAGMAALMVQADPSVSPDTIKMRLMRSAEKRPEYDIFSEGAGFADLLSALNLRETASGPALSPTAVWTPTGILVEGTGVLSGDSAIWGDGAVWGDTAIWGDDPLRGTGAVWGDSVIWGGNTTETSDKSLRGDSVIWGGNNKPKTTSTKTVSGDSIIWGGNLRIDSCGLVSADSVIWGGNQTGPVQGDSVP